MESLQSPGLGAVDTDKGRETQDILSMRPGAAGGWVCQEESESDLDPMANLSRSGVTRIDLFSICLKRHRREIANGIEIKKVKAIRLVKLHRITKNAQL